MEPDLEGAADEIQSRADRGGEVDKETLDALAIGIGNHWIEGYGSLGSVQAIVGAAVVGISIMEMVTCTII